MRRACLILSVAISGSGLACDSPTGVAPEPLVARFSLSDGSATAFDDALRDIRQRVLPGLRDIDTSQSLGPLIDAISGAIATRDRRALRDVLARTEAAVASLSRADDAATFASDLDTVRLILEHARPLADGASEPAVHSSSSSSNAATIPQQHFPL